MPFVSSFPSPLALLRSRLRSKWRRTGTSQSRESLACSRLSHSVRTFSISRTRLSRSLEQAFRGSAESRKWSVTIIKNRPLFGLYVLFPLQVTWYSLGPFINYAYICVHLKLRNLKETILWGNINLRSGVSFFLLLCFFGSREEKNNERLKGIIGRGHGSQARVTSRGIKWVNKPYKLKRPIKRLRVRNWSWTLLGLLKYSQTSLIRTPKGQYQVSALQRCPYFWGRERYHFWHYGEQTNCPYNRGVGKEMLDCML